MPRVPPKSPKADLTRELWTPKNIVRLNAAIAAAKTVPQRRLLLAKKAGALARLTMVEEARKIVLELRRQNPDYEPQLSSWIMYAEGLIEHFSNLGDQAFDRLRRAYAISAAIGDDELAAISAAWVANAALMDGNVRGIAEPLAKVFTLADRSNREALARACLVIADAESWAGEYERASHWYQKARDFAVDDGDLAMQSVVLFNTAAFRLAQLITQDCLGSVDPGLTSLVSASIDSVGSLDFGLGMDGLGSMVPLLRAEVRSVEHRWAEAIALFNEHIEAAPSHGQARLVPKYRAELAFCLVQTGQSEQAKHVLSLALSEIGDCTEDDDLFILHSRAANVLCNVGNQEGSEVQSSLAAQCLASFKRFQESLRHSIGPMIEQVALART